MSEIGRDGGAIDLSGFRGEHESDSDFAAASAEILKDAGAEEQAGDAPADGEEPDVGTPPTAEADPEPEPLELEKATAALRRAGFDDDDIKAMSRAKIIKRGLHLAKVQSDTDRVFTEHKALSEQAKAKESKLEPVATKPTAPDELEVLRKSMIDDGYSEQVAAALVEQFRKASQKAEEANRALSEYQARQAEDALQRAFVKSYPEGDNPETWEDVKTLALQAEARGVGTPEECLAHAAKKLKLRTSAEIERASNADKNLQKRNGSVESSGRGSATKKPLNMESVHEEAWLARMNGKSLDEMDKILSRGR